MTQPDPDAMLLARAQRGDMRAFEMLVVKYQRRVERLIARQVHDPDSVQDLAQETFLRAYRALPNFRGESAFYTWLYRIAVNTARQSRAASAHDPLQQPSVLEAEFDDRELFRADPALSDQATPETLLASKQLAGELYAAVQDLPDEFRQVLMLREVDGLSYEAIADQQACPVGTVRSRIYRAREAVAKRLRPLLGTDTKTRW